MKLFLIGLQSDSFHFLQISLLIPVHNEGIKDLNPSIFLTGVLSAKNAVFYSLMLQAAPGNGAGLIPFSTSAAWTVFPDIHDAKATVQSAKRKKRILSAEILQHSPLPKFS